MMMGTSSSSSSSCNNLNLFTAAQWEELEQQALIYKYMVSGVPVPTHLILSVRRSLYNSAFSNPSSNQSTTLGVWEGNFQYNQLYQIGGGGYGRKIDLEPGRCRRTDGKKWRCSKEAYPDSKYCERHMHRGRNRSRKPVEFSSSSSSSSSIVNVSSSPSTATRTRTTTTNANANTLIGKSISVSDHDYQNTLLPLYSSSRPSAIQNNFMDYRYLQGEDERSAYFQLNDPYTTQKMAAGAGAGAGAASSDHNNYSLFNFQNLKDQQDKNEETEGQHCFVMGTDFIKSSEETTKVDETTHNKQPFHHFFSPPKPNQDPAWIDVDQHHNFIDPPKSPLSTQDLFQSKPRPYW